MSCLARSGNLRSHPLNAFIRFSNFGVVALFRRGAC
jgi:hypothetical protein